MSFCVNCGTKIEEGIKFCPGCGMQVGAAGVSINQEKAVNIIQAQPPVLSTAPQNQGVIMADEKYCFSCGSVIKRAAVMCPRCGVSQSMRSGTMAIDVYCTSCGKTIKKEATICPFCGVRQEEIQAPPQPQPQPAVMPTAPQNQSAIMADEKYCFSCGSIIKKAAEICPKCGVNQSTRSSTAAIDVYCTSCGKTIKKEATVCPFCGVRQGEVQTTGYPPGYVPKNKTTAIIFWLFGLHRFYVGKIGTGILYLVTIAGMGIWSVIDIVLLATDKFTDKNGYPLSKN